MPLNVHFEFINQSHHPNAKLSHNSLISNPFRPYNLTPVHLASPKKNGLKQLSKMSPPKNHLKSPRNNCFPTLQLRALLKKAKEVSPSQTFLPPKTTTPRSAVTIKLEKPQTGKGSQSRPRLSVEFCGNGSKQTAKLTERRQGNEQVQNKDEENCILEQANQEMGSLSQIIFFGDQDKDQDIELLRQRISRGWQLQCLELLDHLKHL